jgi:hypothetical protein
LPLNSSSDDYCCRRRYGALLLLCLAQLHNKQAKLPTRGIAAPRPERPQFRICDAKVIDSWGTIGISLSPSRERQRSRSYPPVPPTPTVGTALFPSPHDAAKVTGRKWLFAAGIWANTRFHFGDSISIASVAFPQPIRVPSQLLCYLSETRIGVRHYDFTRQPTNSVLPFSLRRHHETGSHHSETGISELASRRLPLLQ